MSFGASATTRKTSNGYGGHLSPDTPDRGDCRRGSHRKDRPQTIAKHSQRLSQKKLVSILISGSPTWSSFRKTPRSRWKRHRPNSPYRMVEQYSQATSGPFRSKNPVLFKIRKYAFSVLRLFIDTYNKTLPALAWPLPVNLMI
jgi:hypothetical protein